MQEMENSAGSADAEMSNIESSLNYKLNALSETWTQTWQNMVDRGTVGGVIDFLTSVSEGIGFVISKIGVLGDIVIIGGGVGIAQFIKNLD